MEKHIFMKIRKILVLQFADSDSSVFSWIEVNGKKERNPDFLSDYIEHIKSLIGKVDYIFVSSHGDVRDATR